MSGLSLRRLPGDQLGPRGQLLPDRSPPPLAGTDSSGEQIVANSGGLGTRGTTRQSLVLLPIPIGGVIQWQLVAPYNPNRNYLLLQNQTGGAVIQVAFKNPTSLTQDLGTLVPSGGNYELNIFVPVDPVYVATLSTAINTSNLTVVEG